MVKLLGARMPITFRLRKAGVKPPPDARGETRS
jgi:hypothetical protein